MTRFHLAENQRGLVGEALGKEWVPNPIYKSWEMHREFILRGDTYSQEFMATGRNGYVEVLINVDWASYSREELEQVHKVIVEAENRLRAAGLKEVEA